MADNQQTDGPIPAAEIKELFQLLVGHGSDINQKSASESVLLIVSRMASRVIATHLFLYTEGDVVREIVPPDWLAHDDAHQEL